MSENTEVVKKPNAKKKWILIIGSALLLIAVILFFALILPMINYSQGKKAFDAADYVTASERFAAANTYKDAEAMWILSQKGIHYNNALTALNEFRFDDARNEFTSAEDFMDAPEQFLNVDLAESYHNAVLLYEEASYSEAVEIFSDLIDFSDSKGYIRLCADSLFEDEDFYNAAIAYLLLDDEESQTYGAYSRGRNYFNMEQYDAARGRFQVCSGFMDADILYWASYLSEAEAYFSDGDLYNAMIIYEDMPLDFEYDDVSVSERMDQLNAYPQFVQMTRRSYFDSPEGEITGVTCRSSWNSQPLDEYRTTTAVNPSIRCFIRDDGQVNMVGEVLISKMTGLTPYTSYYWFETDTIGFNYTGTELPETISTTDMYTTITFTEDTMTLSYDYTDSWYNIDFNYKTTIVYNFVE